MESWRENGLRSTALYKEPPPQTYTRKLEQPRIADRMRKKRKETKWHKNIKICTEQRCNSDVLSGGKGKGKRCGERAWRSEASSRRCGPPSPTWLSLATQSAIPQAMFWAVTSVLFTHFCWNFYGSRMDQNAILFWGWFPITIVLRQILSYQRPVRNCKGLRLVHFPGAFHGKGAWVQSNTDNVIYISDFYMFIHL